MPSTITVRLNDEVYRRIKDFAQSERRAISNFIENATLSYIEKSAFMDDLEMMEILNNKELINRIRKGSKDAKEKKGEFVE
ncbi:CopG family transcriptional regulator [bacterium]|nr:CopG family transcriptional regulator [bacterium]MBU1753212.1 CopG family transcriptional regulator [bacterium]